MAKAKHRFIVLPQKELQMLEEILEESKKMNFDVKRVDDEEYISTKLSEIGQFLRFCYPKFLAIDKAARAEKDDLGGDELLALFTGNLLAGMSVKDLEHIRDQMRFISTIFPTHEQDAVVFVAQNCGRIEMACEYHKRMPKMARIDLLVNLKQHLEEARDVLLFVPEGIRTKRQTKKIEAIEKMLEVLEPMDVSDDEKNKRLNLETIFNDCNKLFEENKDLFVTKTGLLGKLQKLFQAIVVLFVLGREAFRTHLEKEEELKKDESKVTSMFGS